MSDIDLAEGISIYKSEYGGWYVINPQNGKHIKAFANREQLFDWLNEVFYPRLTGSKKVRTLRDVYRDSLDEEAQDTDAEDLCCAPDCGEKASPTLFDHYAAAALTAIMSGKSPHYFDTHKANMAFRMARTILKERKNQL